VLAALGDPAVLLLDEPYQGFDGAAFLDFWEQVWHWRDAGTAVVVVTHRPEQLKRVDHVLDLTTTGRPLASGAGGRR
jgi:ABC-2 type transport system ATP-binding protein